MSGTHSQLQRAIDQIQDKGPLPEIDFTQHQLENGFTISTQERVVKEVRFALGFSVLCRVRRAERRRRWSTGPGSGYEHPYRRPVLFEIGSE